MKKQAIITGLIFALYLLAFNIIAHWIVGEQVNTKLIIAYAIGSAIGGAVYGVFIYYRLKNKES